MYPSLKLCAFTDKCWNCVQPRERPGTHPNGSGTIKYPQFDYLHTSLDQTVQELEHDQVWHFTCVWHISFTYTVTWETWDPSQWIRHHQLPPVWLFTHLSSSNGSRVRAWPSFDTLHAYRHVADTCTDTWEAWDPSQCVRHPKIPPLWPLAHLSSSNGSGVRA